MSDIQDISVEVAYALPNKQKIVEMLVSPGTTALQAAQHAGLEKEFPDLDIENSKMGVFGQTLGTKGLKKPAEYVLQPGDRVEIYRPLIADPREARRKRAAKAEAAEDREDS